MMRKLLSVFAVLLYCSMVNLQAQDECLATVGEPILPLTQFSQDSNMNVDMIITDYGVAASGTDNIEYVVLKEVDGITDPYDWEVIGVTEWEFDGIGTGGGVDFTTLPPGNYHLAGFAFSQSELDAITFNILAGGVIGASGGESLSELFILFPNITAVPIPDPLTINAVLSVLNSTTIQAIIGFAPCTDITDPADVHPFGVVATSTAGCEVTPATISVAGGGNSATVCAGSDDMVSVAVVIAPVGNTNGAFVITDENGTTILDGPLEGPDFAFTAAPVGVCQIWHVAWDTNIDIPTNLVADITGDCVSLSNPITITREDCSVGGCSVTPAVISVAGGGNSATVCAGSGDLVSVAVAVAPVGNTNGAFVITDENGTTILDGPLEGPDFTFAAAPVGVCQIWHVAWDTNIDIPTNLVADITGDCVSLSNPITITREDCSVGGCSVTPAVISVAGGGNSATVCAGSDDVVSVAVAVPPVGNTNGAFVITDGNGVTILDGPLEGPDFTFTAAPVGVCQIWHVAWDTNIDIPTNLVADITGDCVSLSNPITITREDCSVGGPCISASVSSATQFVCAGGSFTVPATISDQGANGVVGYLVHSEAQVSPLNILAQNASGVFSMSDIAGAVMNTTYYISAVVSEDDNGNGIPDIGETCFAIAGGGSAVFLMPITVVDTDVVCDEDTAITSVNYTITGGLPAFDSSNVYTLTGDINATASIGQIVSVEYIDGATYSVSATDGASCSGMSTGGPLQCSKLPVEYVSYDGYLEGEQVILNWVTATEIDSDFFSIERSRDGQNFVVIGQVQAAGNSLSEIAYHFVDSDIECGGTRFYRLTQVDYNGQENINEDLVRLEMPSCGFLVSSVSPNPASDFVQVIFNGNTSELLTLEVFDLTGKLLMQETVNVVEGGSQSTTLDVSKVSAGIYILTVENDGIIETSKLIVD